MKKSTIIAIVSVATVILLASIATFMMLGGANSDSATGESESSSESVTAEDLKKAVSLSDIEYSPDKINIYLFWGNGCSVCKSFIEFMVENYPKYHQYFNFYAFEVWYDDDNHQLFKDLADSIGATANGIPFYIIGTKAFTGFSASKGEETLETIVSEYENRASADTTIQEFLQNYKFDDGAEESDDTTASESAEETAE